jgi:uncharacterized protein (DUF1501 family)
MKRRDFIHNSLAGVVMPSLLNGVSMKAFGGITDTNMSEDNVLVIIQLNGGNDGMNMVVPIDKYDLYLNARKNIAIPKEKLLKVLNNDTLGLHPAMTGLQSLFNEGKASLIQSVGYPSPNFSHFRATDIWNSGSSSNVYLNSGWAGRYLSINNPNYPTGYPNSKATDPLAIQIGSVVSTAFQGPITNMGLAITNPTNFYNLVTGKSDAVPNTLAGKGLSYLRTIAQSTNQYANTIKTAAGKVTTQGTYPTGNSLADQLKIVARLIGGGLKTKVYMVNIGGFDTHSNQVAGDFVTGSHATLLGRVSDAIKAFMDDLKALGVSKKVIGMTYSEFGRRIKSNDSMGTDHGAAAPMFMFGDLVQPVILGKTPDISTTPLVGDNIPMQYDFRSVYNSILENWFCMDGASLNDVIPGSFQQLPLIQGVACGKITSTEDPMKLDLISNYPNPFDSYTNISFTTRGGHTMIQLFDNMGRLIGTPVDNDYVAGTHEVYVETGGLQSGLYYARLQNNEIQQVQKMYKR